MGRVFESTPRVDTRTQQYMHRTLVHDRWSLESKLTCISPLTKILNIHRILLNKNKISKSTTTRAYVNYNLTSLRFFLINISQILTCKRIRIKWCEIRNGLIRESKIIYRNIEATFSKLDTYIFWECIYTPIYL